MGKRDKKVEVKEKKEHKILKKLLIILIIAVVVLAISFALSYVKWKNLATEMTNVEASTVLDTDGNVIATLGAERIQETVEYSQIPDNLKNAYIAIEDERYEKHIGIDVKRTGAAIFTYIKNGGSSSFGGSTITQQLVKNMTGENSATISRKVKEWVKAIELETFLTKDEILCAYLNLIYTGPNVYGVEMGSQYYFSKSVSELNLIECAFLAGINNSPNSYNPFNDTDNEDKIISRTKTVLSKMEELRYITEDEYDEAIASLDAGELVFKKGNVSAKSDGVYSYHTDALINEVISDLEDKYGISETFATNYLYLAGVTIQSTQDSSVQQAVESELEKSKYVLKSASDSSVTSQAAMVIIDHTTGYVVACGGGLGEKTEVRGFNRATSAIRQTGSAGKPISVLVPAISEKIVTAASVFVDIETTFDDGTEEGYTPTDYNGFLGAITLRRAVESSQNIPFVKIMEKLTPAKSISYMKKMGITTLTENDDNLNLALGGLDKGISPLELAGAYATIANDGVYIEPTFYTEITTSEGSTVLETSQKSRRVFSEAVAYVVKELLTQPVTGSNGTATYCKITGIETAAKTGTTNDSYDRWLCGFTPYYTAVTWYGFDISERINYSGTNPAGQIWASVMSTIHANLPNAEFEQPYGIETATICPTSGKVANDNCTGTYTEYFLEGTVPETCNVH